MDTVARLGGDEFVVLMEDLHETGDCASLAEELILEISRPMQLREHTVEIGASMGVAFFPEDGCDPEDLMKRADLAMYAAKSAGRHTYRFFQQDMLERTSQRLSLVMDLRHAISGGELVLHYQPMVAMATGASVGVEALVRWQHPVHGLLLPVEFIPLAEESGLILDLGAWVLDEACRQAAQWRAAGCAVKVAVNVSSKDLETKDLCERIASLLARHGTAPADLEIEFTEAAVMDNPVHAIGMLARLRELGLSVAVDGFGTGNSSLTYLKRLPIDVLKIDRSFTMSGDDLDADAQILKTFLALGQALGLSVVAQGVETRSQADLLQSLGCDAAQGNFFSRPLPTGEIVNWLLDARKMDPRAIALVAK
jgi:predicted signal transduction protein with EAL and GGDEF domain